MKETFLTYITASDYIDNTFNNENAKLKEKTGDENALILEGGIKLAANLYAKRFITFVGYPIVLASRLSGIDAAVRIATDTPFPFSKSK